MELIKKQSKVSPSKQSDQRAECFKSIMQTPKPSFSLHITKQLYLGKRYRHPHEHSV